MNWLDNINDKLKRTVRSWLQIQPSSPYNIQIQELADFDLCAIRNRIWYRGDSSELQQMYAQCQEYADRFKFWACKSTPGMEIRKIHTGLPKLIVNTLCAITLADMYDFDFDNDVQSQTWEEIDKENNFRSIMEDALRDALTVGDGVFRIILDTSESKHPIIEWVPGERVEYIREYGRIHEIVIRIPYPDNHVLLAHYGKGYIHHELYKGDTLQDIKTYPPTAGVTDWQFDEGLMLAVPFMIFKNARFEGRGGSIFDSKLDNFDSFDEIWSQWMDALRAGRAKTYVPESCIPRNPNTGELMRPNSFDNRFIAGSDNMSENGKNTIQTEQPAIPHDSYLASYVTALDLCLQGIISPSTLGIDTKKLDNAEAQREKEKTTLYTRQAIVDAMQAQIPDLISQCINAENVLHHKAPEDVKVTLPFGEYANPSFEAQVETLAKARPGTAMMSIEAQVEELYGDSKDDEWKQEEIERLKAEQGVAAMQDPSVSMDAGDFSVSLEDNNESEGNEPPVQDGKDGVQKAPANRKCAGAVWNLCY